MMTTRSISPKTADLTPLEDPDDLPMKKPRALGERPWAAARPQKEEVKTERFQIRCSLREKTEISRIAAERGLSVSEYIVESALLRK